MIPSRFKNFIERIDDLETIRSFIEKLNLPVPLEPNATLQSTLLACKKALSGFFDGFANQTIHYVVNKAVFEEKLRQNVYDGKPHDLSEKNTWLNYINYEKSVPMNQHPNILYIIEKATTYLCTCPEIWRELVEYLENVVQDRQYLLGTLHNYRKILRNVE